MKRFPLIAIVLLLISTAAGAAGSVDPNAVYLFYGRNMTPGAAKGQAELRDQKRNLLHTWKTERAPFNAAITPQGDLYTLSVDPSQRSHLLIPAPFLERFNWEGKKLWTFQNPLMHHDFELLSNDRVAVLIWEKMPQDLAKKVKGGHLTIQSRKEMYGDAIVELDQNGKEVWRWSAHEHLSPEKHMIGAYHPRDEWTHANSIRFIEKNPLDGDPAYLISFRSLNQVMIVSRKTKKILWESPVGQFSAQHDAQWLEDGKILVFDNGLDKITSRIVEMDLKSKRITWEFAGGWSTPLAHLQFFTSVMGAVQKISNDSYLVTNSVPGQFFIVNKASKVTDRFFNPLMNPEDAPWPYQPMFRLRLSPRPPQAANLPASERK